MDRKTVAFGVGGKNGKVGAHLLDHWYRHRFLRGAHATRVFKAQKEEELACWLALVLLALPG